MAAADTTRRRPRAERRDAVENRERILRTAADLIVTRGYNVPLTEIAEAAGVGVGTFYRGFPDRGALMDELQRRGYDLLLTTLARISSDGLTGADAIEEYLHQCLAMSNQLVALPLRGATPLTDDTSVDAKKRIVRSIGAFLSRGRDDGSIHHDVTAHDVVVCATFIATPLPNNPDKAARRHIALFMRGLRTDSGHD